MDASSNARKYETGNPLKRWLLHRFMASMTGAFNGRAPARALDVGCGEGFLMRVLRKAMPSTEWTGVDLSEPALKQAREQNPGVTFRQASVYELPFEDGAFDAVLCAEVLEHVEEPDRALKELLRVCSDRLLVSVPNEPWFRLSQLAALSYVGRLGNHPEHIQHWGARAFQKWVGRYVEVDGMLTPYPWSIVAAHKGGADHA